MSGKRILLVLAFLAAFLLAYAAESQIVRIPGSGAVVYPQQNRESYFSHHGSTADYNLYGSNKWAVRYNFRTAYPGVAHCSFSIQKARIYFPNIGDSVTVSLYSDVNTVPSQLMASARVAVDDDTLDVTFPTTVQMEVVWLVVDYNTNFQNRFVSASDGDGSHSFYWNTNAITPYFQNFSQAGFNCELLFGLIGNFNLDTPDLQLVSFDLSGNLRPRESAKPVFSIYNHSNLAVSDARINLEITSPDTTVYQLTQSITINETIQPHTLLEVPATGYPGYNIALPLTGMQLRLQATLVSSLAESDTTLANNTVNKYITVYGYGYPITVVEDFFRNSSVAAICGIQDSYPQPGVHPLLYFPNLSDSLSNLGAYQRLTWYGFNAVPTTAVMGKERIIGFNQADYLNKYQTALNKAKAKRSFISSASSTMEQAATNEYMTIDIQLNNANTRLFTSPALNPATNSRFFVGLFKKYLLAGQQRYVFDRWIAFADTINSTMNYGSATHKNYTMSLVNLTLEQLQANYRIYYWLQDRLGGTIHYANYSALSFTSGSAIEDELVPSPNLSAYPNPLRAGNSLKLNGIGEYSAIHIYNLRGQCIWKATGIKADAEIPASIFKASGIYFIKSETANGRHKQTIKISVIK